MGKQQGEQRQQLFLHGTCLLAALFLLMNGCTATTLNFKKEWQGRRCLDQAEQWVKEGNYGEAIKAYDQVIALSPGAPPGDSALFGQGILWAHPDNAQKNHKKALKCFQRLVRDFPRSDLTYQGNVMISMLNDLTACYCRNESVEKTLNACKHQLDELKKIDIGIEEKKRKEPSKE